MARAKKTQDNAKENVGVKETRDELNSRARFDYGILNAEDMKEKQLYDEIAAIDKQAEDARKADAKAAKEADSTDEV